MNSIRPYLAALGLALVSLAPANGAEAQLGRSEAVGQLYRLTPPIAAGRYFDAVQVERVSRLPLVMPAPIDPLPLGIALSTLTGQILEVPQRQRIYFTAVDAVGALRLFEIDLLARQAREIVPQADVGPPYAAFFQAAPDASKLYVVWFASGLIPRTDIYDGMSLGWLGRTAEFRPDERASGFEHRPPYMWTLDAENRPVLVDTQRDRVVRNFDYKRLFGPVRGVVADAWRDLLLVRLEIGHDRYRVVDVVSGEIGPPLDLDGYRQAQPRLMLSGRVLALIDMMRRPPSAARRWAETAIATGSGVLYDLRSGRELGDFTLIVPPEFPVSAVGTTDDPGVPGRLWLHVPGDDQRFDFLLAACDRKSPDGRELAVGVDALWDSGDPSIYRYRIRVAASSHTAVGAIAIESGQQSDRTSAPEGWGVDLIKRDRWVRWSNGLGPPEQDIAPGTTGVGFVIAARPDTRPSIAEFRAQAAIGLPRGCESDDRFLKNSLSGYTLGPEAVESAEPRKLAKRLEGLVDKACEIGWIADLDCPTLSESAHNLESSQTNRAVQIDAFLDVLSGLRSAKQEAVIVLTDAAGAFRASLEQHR